MVKSRQAGRLAAIDTSRAYRAIFILDSRDWFLSCRDRYDPQTDLVLTYDFALRREIEALGGAAGYLDHLVNREVMEQNNFLAYEFFRDWHRDASGADLFEYEGTPFGRSFRIDYWNDYIFFVRAQLCLDRLAELRFESVFAGTELGLAESLLAEMGVTFARVDRQAGASQPRYYFPIHTWMQERIRHTGVKGTLLNLFAWGLGSVLAWSDRAFGRRTPAVFVQEYHPTRDIIERLRREGRVRVVGSAVSRTRLWSRYIPLWRRAAPFEPLAADLLARFRAKRVARLVLSNGRDVTTRAYEVIERCVVRRVAESLRTLACVHEYLNRHPISLDLLIGNVGDFVTLVDCAARARGVPSYLVINGILAAAFTDEGKCATVINAYSSSIRTHYFRGMDNVVSLGDPRMDRYPPAPRRRPARPDNFTVVVGASGHSNVDLNSYLAVEFDFLHDVLQALSIVKQRGVNARVVIKVRSNGYREQYERFTAEYCPGVVDEILDQASMTDVLARADFFISIYSQTLFEASCLGIPCLYYRADAQVLDPPFDGRSELVTVDTVDDLVRALEDFRGSHPRYDAFLDRSVMEKYVGPLDGGNVQRNLDYLYRMLDGDWSLHA